MTMETSTPVQRDYYINAQYVEVVLLTRSKRLPTLSRIDTFFFHRHLRHGIRRGVDPQVILQSLHTQGLYSPAHLGFSSIPSYRQLWKFHGADDDWGEELAFPDYLISCIYTWGHFTIYALLARSRYRRTSSPYSTRFPTHMSWPPAWDLITDFVILGLNSCRFIQCSAGMTFSYRSLSGHLCDQLV